MKIQLFKKANDKAGAEVDPKDPTKQKWNAESVYVKIENEMVPLSELAKHAKENEFVAIPESIENEMEINGAVHNVSDLIENYKASKKNGEDKKEEKKKENEEEKDKEMKKDKKNEEEKKDKEEKKENEEKKDKEEKKENEEKKEEKEEKENKDEEEEVEETLKKQSKKNEAEDKKDLRHFVRLNTARENGTTQNVVTIDTMTSRIERGKNRYSSDS